MIDDNSIEQLIMKKMFERYAVFPDAVHSLDGRSINTSSFGLKR